MNERNDYCYARERRKAANKRLAFKIHTFGRARGAREGEGMR